MSANDETLPSGSAARDEANKLFSHDRCQDEIARLRELVYADDETTWKQMAEHFQRRLAKLNAPPQNVAPASVSEKEIESAASNYASVYYDGSNWAGFKAGAKWAIERLRDLAQDTETQHLRSNLQPESESGISWKEAELHTKLMSAEERVKQLEKSNNAWAMVCTERLARIQDLEELAAEVVGQYLRTYGTIDGKNPLDACVRELKQALDKELTP